MSEDVVDDDDMPKWVIQIEVIYMSRPTFLRGRSF